MGSHLEQNMSAPEPSLKPPLDLRPADLVSRLLAATPPYLYTPFSNSFFFSEMLRSFVQARASPPGGPRRGRKRSWKDARPTPMDKPLELTTNPKPPPSPPVKADSPKETPSTPMIPPCGMLSLPTPDMLPPPTAPLWYPPMSLYPPPPPQCFDPHFFVDLRVSGHIWDRKPDKESPTEPLNLQTEEKKNVLNLSFRKHNSAFSVPRQREHRERQESPTSSHGTHYVLQNLGRIYEDVKTKQKDDAEERDAEKKDDEELTPEEKKVRDLRALIGLELVVDYVKQEDSPGAKARDEDEDSDEEDDQEPLVMD